MKLAFIVCAVPVAQPRQRTRVMAMHGKVVAHNYTPTMHPVNAFKAAVQAAAHAAYTGPPLEGPVELQLTFVMPRPAAKCWKSRSMPREPYTGKMDWDNLAKSVCDSLNKLLWRDDGQVWRAFVEAWVASGYEQPHCVVTVLSDT